MRLYDKSTTYSILGGIVFLHGIILGLCIFWIYRFLIITYDPSVYLLIGGIIGMLVFCDILLHQSHVVGRFLIRCKFDETGIYCYGLGWKSWRINWADVCFYGIEGFSQYNFGILFISADANEKFDVKRYADITPLRIVFQVRDEIWQDLERYMPNDMKQKLFACSQKRHDCFYLRSKK